MASKLKPTTRMILNTASTHKRYSKTLRNMLVKDIRKGRNRSARARYINDCAQYGPYLKGE